MIVCTPDGRSKIVNVESCIDMVQQIIGTTPGFDIVYDNDGVYVNDERRNFENDSGISFLVIRTEYWERAWSQAQQDHERKQSIQQDVHGETKRLTM